jgi:hypothetical protein
MVSSAFSSRFSSYLERQAALIVPITILLKVLGFSLVNVGKIGEFRQLWRITDE